MYKVVIVDDEGTIVHSLCKYIAAQLPEFEVTGTFANGCDALHFLREHPADIVLTDICMPQMDGLALAKALSEQLPQCVVIILSGFGEFEYAQQAIRYHVFTYILKPLDYRELKGLLHDAVQTASERRIASAVGALESDTAVRFFRDLLFGAFFSQKELRSRYEQLRLPTPLEQTQGYLARLSLTAAPSPALQPAELCRALEVSAPDIRCYYVRRTEREYFFLILSEAPPAQDSAQRAVRVLEKHFGLRCSVELYRSFSSLREFVQVNRTVSGQSNAQVEPYVQLMQKAIRYIRRHYSEDLSRESVAAAFYLSPSHFSALFKQETGCSFKDYLTNVRMQTAVELLSTPMLINDIAEKVGYHNRNRFIINFKNYTSYTPTEYRKQVLSMEDT